MIDDGIIRLSPDENGITVHNYDTTVDTDLIVNVPILAFTDDRHGDEIHILLNPADAVAPRLLKSLTAYVNALCARLAELAEDDQ
ncbi:hypothetical protein GCM10010528_24460 [Gordonia defluvii]|jgi:hypothetical protein|uniref:Uncharacterized protein n=1 Tax=Gordonia defluvii TaxID=283718 RepID=A0ABP6LHX2_9ACTN|nr:hypothetical protein [Gordonia sp. UBA5067]